MTTVAGTHKRFVGLVLKHGTPEEREAITADVHLLRQQRTIVPGSSWEPIEDLVLPSFLLAHAERQARARQKRAAAWHLANKHGVRRTFQDELRAAQAQLAVCVMVGQRFDVVKTHVDAKVHGNIGGDMSAFCPRPGNPQLVIGEKEPKARTFFMVAEHGKNRYRMVGWVKAKEAKREEFQREFVRDGVISRPYMVDPGFLHPLSHWFS